MVIDDTDEVIPYIAQGNVTDWEFLKERAERIGFELYVELDEFHFHKPQDYLKRIPGTYGYRNNLKSFEPRLTTQDQVSKVIVKGWDAQKKEPIIAVATSATVVERQVLGSRPGSDFVKDDFGEGTRILYDRVPGTQKEAEEIAKAFFRQKEYELIEGHGTCIGDPTLKAKSLISIAGVGQKFSGDYYVTRVSHTMDESGYLCEFDCKRNAVSAPDERGTAKVEAAAGLGYGI
jgi:phage protein D